MQRRIALALALAFTTVVVFSMVAVGANAGFFSDAKKKASTQNARAYEQPAAADPSASGAQPAAAPQVVTDYVYLDETPVPDVTYVLRKSQPAAADVQSQQKHDEKQQPTVAASQQSAASTPALPQPTAPAATPTQPAAEAVAPTQPPASATPTSAPPTSTPAPTQAPTAPPPSGSCPTEFVSTVTAIQPASQGNWVTWANGAVTLVTGRSTPHVGVQYQVHTQITSAGCTATEIGD
jgi:hypothetical protein